MRYITITTGGWIDNVKPRRKRGDIMKMIFSLAGSEHYEIRMEGEHWNAS